MNKYTLIKSKIVSGIDFMRLLSIYRFKNQKIVFTNGCFDLIHLGHVKYLTRAADLGDILIIGLNSDSSVIKIKGHGRPVLDQESRALTLAAFSFVNNIVLFDEETPYKLIKQIRPDILVKGGDYNPEEIVGYDIVKDNGGEVKMLDFIKGYSTSNIIKGIASQIHPEK
ncbi:MAG: D-glycero-beta-D-manno-heptose 1-phosphate adenylyltransferase [Bacteroidales bacterium]|nr:D-glycero-beta-D-manno-heptose 1-phosphate adenylyltransferase [Bacteroidales bacterium]